MNRTHHFTRLAETNQPFDLIVIGGGATGVGIALDAASRGYSTCLLERYDFGKGTSSRSTKLVHGGVRYLQQGNLTLVTDALRERGILRANAPHVVHDQPFVIPAYGRWDRPYYGLGLKVYDRLSGKWSFGRSELLSRKEVLARIPNLKPDGLRGGVLYHDGQFDDARLLINLVQTAAELGAVVLNYACVNRLTTDPTGRINGVKFVDVESGVQHTLAARCVVNAAGPFSDQVRRLAEPDAPASLTASQGVHIVLDASFLAGGSALMVPRTPDGRVMFAIPWQGHVVVGTTDTPIPAAAVEPTPLESEIDFILETANRYLARPATRADVLSVFTGIRPLAGGPSKHKATAALSRDHAVSISAGGLVSITGGKWTTYRKMAEDVVDRVVAYASLPPRPCRTRELPIHGCCVPDGTCDDFTIYGSDAPMLRKLAQEGPAPSGRLHPGLPLHACHVLWGARREYARTVEDVLARRSRALFLNAGAALEVAPKVAELLAREFDRTPSWVSVQLDEFAVVAGYYRVPSANGL